MIDAKRRILLKGSLAASAIGVAIGAGLLTPRMVLAAWPEAAFNAQNLDDALKGLLGSAAHEPSDKIDLKAILSRYEDADAIEVFNDIVQQESAFQAALSVTGRVSQLSILDYL